MSLKFSKKFLDILQRISYNKLSNHLINIGCLSDSFDYNYIGISEDSNRLVTFTPSDKVEKLLSELPKVYGVNSVRNLTHSDSNDKIFGLLGYDKYSNEYWYPQPSCGCDKGDMGTILNEVVSPTSGKTYVLYKCLDTGRLSVVNKEVLVQYNNSDLIFTLNRNSIKIGRLVTNILSRLKVDFVVKDVEDFVNLYKSSYDFAVNRDMQFDLVSGDRIAFWYKYDNYVSGGGQLSNSCMANSPSKTFDIYTKNVKCSMLILYSDDGCLKEGSYKSEYIKGRALLWDVVYKGQDIKFLDRIYTNNDSDIELFKAYAKDKGWYYKVEQSMEPGCGVTNGIDFTNDCFEIEIDAKGMDLISGSYFPYMDTMCFWYEEDGKFFLTNDNNRNHVREFRCTNGLYIKMENGREVGCFGGTYDEGGLSETHDEFDEAPLSDVSVDDYD